MYTFYLPNCFNFKSMAFCKFHCKNRGDVDAILDARTTESMMFDMISRISHHLILVVNDNTWLEQEYAAMLLRVFGEGLIVVHNMRMTSCAQEAQELFALLCDPA